MSGVPKEAPKKSKVGQRITEGRKRGEERERGEAKETKRPSPKGRVAPARLGYRLWVGCVGCGEPRTRDLRFRVCEDRSDVLFELSAAEDRRLYKPESARDQSDTYLMLMAFFPVDEPCIRFVGQRRD